MKFIRAIHCIELFSPFTGLVALEAAKVGESTLTIATSDKAFLIAIDPSGDASIKAAIDGLATSKGAAATPVEGVVELAGLPLFCRNYGFLLESMLASLTGILLSTIQCCHFPY